MKSKIFNIKIFFISSLVGMFLLSFSMVFGQKLQNFDNFTQYAELVQNSIALSQSLTSMDDVWQEYCIDISEDDSIITNGGFEDGFPENTELSVDLYPFVFCNWELSPLNVIPLSSLENSGFPFVFSASAWPLDTRAVRLNLTQQADVFGGQNNVHQAHPFISSYLDISSGDYDFNFTYSAINTSGFTAVESFGLAVLVLDSEQMDALKAYSNNDIYNADGSEAIFGDYDYQYEDVLNFFTENLAMNEEQFVHLSETNDFSLSSDYEEFFQQFVLENSYDHLVVMPLGYGPDFDMNPGSPASLSLFIDNVSLTFNIFGCTDPTAVNFDSQANQDDGSCNYYGYLLNNITQGANQSSGNLSISGDGTVLVFDSLATNLVSGDANNQRDIFMAQYNSLTDTYVVSKISQGYNGDQSNGESRRPHISTNGQYIVFESRATNLVEGVSTNPMHYHVYLYDVASSSFELLSQNENNIAANQNSERSRVSSDGRYVVFESRATNLTEDVLLAQRNIFRVDRFSDTVTLVSRNAQNEPSNQDSFNPDISSSGQKIVFESQATNLVPDTSPAVRNVFLNDMLAGEITLVSEQNSNISFGSNLLSLAPRISNDGENVVFSSNVTDLVEGLIVGGNNNRNIFLYSVTELVNDLITFNSDGGFSNNNSNNPDISADGLIVFDSNATNLVVTDDLQLPINNVFLYEEGSIVQLSVDQETGPGLQPSQNPVISDNGRHVAFLSNAQNFPGGNSLITNVYVVSLQDFEECDLPYDLNNDAVVNIQDFNLFLASFGTLCENGVECPGDFNGDALVNIVDLSLLLAALGDSCVDINNPIDSLGMVDVNQGVNYNISQYVERSPQDKNTLMLVTEITGIRNSSNISLNSYISNSFFTPRFSNSSKIRLDNRRQNYVIENLRPRETVRIYSNVLIPSEFCREPLFSKTELSVFCE
jgi:hypothetical protein